MNVSRAIRRRIRPLWMAALATTAWINREALRRWFGHPRTTTTTTRSAGQAAAGEAGADDVVTIRTTTATWPDLRSRFRRFKSAKRTRDVIAPLEPSSAAEGVKSWD